MKTSLGLWIDHREAKVLAVTEQGEELVLVVSKAEKQLRRSGDSPLRGPSQANQAPADDSRQSILTAHRALYYAAVMASLGGATHILIFGPGEAKRELKKYLLKHKFPARIVAVETADKMTNRQIAAKVKERLMKS